MRIAALALITTLGACATQFPQVVARDSNTFDVRYDAAEQTQAEADARANEHCSNKGGAIYVAEQTGFDGLAYRTYRCAETRQR